MESNRWILAGCIPWCGTPVDEVCVLCGMRNPDWPAPKPAKRLRTGCVELPLFEE